MSFYGLVVIFVLLVVAIYLCAFSAEMRYEGLVNLAFERFSSAIGTMSYLSAANLTGAGQPYINYTLLADGMSSRVK
jgi:hypothetical protein